MYSDLFWPVRRGTWEKKKQTNKNQDRRQGKEAIEECPKM